MRSFSRFATRALTRSAGQLFCQAACIAMLSGCGGATSKGDEPVDPSDVGDDTAIDEGAKDSGIFDDTADSLVDSATLDAEDASLDSGLDTDLDSGPAETGPTDSGADSGALDSGPADSGALDSGPLDSGVVDTGKPDFGTVGDCTLDSDGDGIPDGLEGRFEPGGPVDTDKDGTPDYLDTDSDDDGIPDAAEWVVKGCSADGLNDADGNGIPNFRDLDSDGNGLPDKDEVCPPASVLAKLGKPACDPKKPYDFDLDGTPDFLDFDNDHDGPSSDLTVGFDDKFELVDNAGKYVGLIDSDADGIPDVYDRDSDNDGIYDLDEGLGDTDRDGIPAFRDIDSDGDGIGDKCEAHGGLVDLSKAPADTDGDGVPDVLDLDSDNDGLLDSTEDKDGDCIVDATETNPRKADTDGDGVDDLVEVTLLGIDAAKDATKDPAKAGKFWFKVPYSADGTAKPSPTSSPLGISTTLNQADVAFAIDTTSSMNKVEEALATSIAGTIIPGLTTGTTRIPDLNLGVIGYDDALIVPFGGSAGDSFVWFPNAGNPDRGSFLTPTVSDAIAAATGLNKVTPGGSYPEGTIPALYWAITGDTITFGATGKSFSSPAGLPATRFGGMRFRKDALPIVINASDANMHGGLTTDCNVFAPTTAIPSTLCKPIAYGTNDAKASGLGRSPTIYDLTARLQSAGAKYIGISIHGGGGAPNGKSSNVNRTTDASYYASAVDMLYLARQTGAKVAPSVLGGTVLNCKTQDSAATVVNPADIDGQCPLVFDLQYGGVGLGKTVVDGVIALLKSVRYDVRVEAIPVFLSGVDPVDAFMDSVLPTPTGTDPTTGIVCTPFDTSTTADLFSGPKGATGTDGKKETLKALNPGPTYCFAVTPKPNITVPAKSTVQVFRANLRAIADKPKPPAGPGGSFVLGAEREVIFLVPPTN